jgi:3-hydroxyisobutyrate dehydrogenase-like beta-hydroxyacid dehydrogenase
LKSFGLIGIGKMGKPMGENLLKAGYALTVFARNKEASIPLIEKGAKAADSPRKLIEETDIVVLSLPAPKDVSEVIFGNLGLATGRRVEGRTIIDTSTIDPRTSRLIARRLEAIGINYLDAPVSGGPEGAANASLTFMVGGKKEIFEECADLFEAMGKNIVYMGATGTGTGAKLVNQLLVASNTLAGAEAMQLSMALGLDSQRIIDVIKTSAGDSFAFRRVAPKIAEGEFGSGWQTWLLEKDLNLLVQTEADLGLPSISVKSSREVFSKAVSEGYGNVDSSSVIKTLDKMKTKSNP